MKLEVKNFGPIKKGQIDLKKRVTVFVGYNNSGKTYMSQLLWGINSYESSATMAKAQFIDEDLAGKDHFEVTPTLINIFVKEYASHLRDKYLSQLFNVEDGFFSRDIFIGFHDFIDKVKEQKYSYCILDGSLKNERYSDYYLFEKLPQSLTISKTIQHFSEPLTIPEIIKLNLFDFISRSTISIQEFRYIISRIVFNLLFQPSHVELFLPANRVFYPSYYKYIYSVSKQEKDMINERLNNHGNLESIRSLSKSPYTKAVDALTEKIYELNNDLTVKNYFPDLLEDLKEIIGGDIIIKSAEGIAPIEFYLKLDNGQELDMYMSSSSANQLTTLYLYLKYWAEEKGNFLILDEPEENLHPENQIKLVNLLMKFADRNNNKILITTHSPLITDHINNYTRLSFLKEAGKNVDKIIADNIGHLHTIDNIKHADYGVYFFNGDSIKEYEVGDYGAYFKDFQQAEDKVKDMSNILKEHIYQNLHPDA